MRSLIILLFLSVGVTREFPSVFTLNSRHSYIRLECTDLGVKP